MKNDDIHRFFYEGEELFSRYNDVNIFKLYLMNQKYLEYEYHPQSNKIINVRTCDVDYIMQHYEDQIDIESAF